MPTFTPAQGRYLAFIHAYTNLHGIPPAEAEIATAMSVSGPSVHQMIKKLEQEGLIQRTPGQARSVEILVPEEEIPAWKAERKGTKASPATANAVIAKPVIGKPPASAPAKVYVLNTNILSGPISKSAAKKVSRVIEIRGNQTLEDLHWAIFEAYDRDEEHLYEFQFGKQPFDQSGPTYGHPEVSEDESGGDASATTLDELNLEPNRVFGYWFDFGDDWYHQIKVEQIDQVVPKVKYPRVTKRVGKSPPQYE